MLPCLELESRQSLALAGSTLTGCCHAWNWNQGKAWAVWTTNNTYEAKAFIKQGNRFSSEDGHRLEKIILEQSAKVQSQIYQLEKEFSEDFVRHSEMEALLKQWASKK